jgi:hypothetical protein
MIIKSYIDKNKNVLKIRFKNYKQVLAFEQDMIKGKRSNVVDEKINNLLDLK